MAAAFRSAKQGQTIADIESRLVKYDCSLLWEIPAVNGSLLRCYRIGQSIVIVQLWFGGGFSHYVQGGPKWSDFDADVQRIAGDPTS